MTNPPSWARFVVFEVRLDRCRLGLSPLTLWRWCGECVGGGWFQGLVGCQYINET